MKTLPLILGYALSVRLPEIIIFLLGALILGISIHYFWTSRNSIRIQKPEPDAGINDNDNWKLKYYADMEVQEKTLQQLRVRLAESEENEKIFQLETEELREEVELLKEKCFQAETRVGKAEAQIKPPTITDDYLQQLKYAQENLFQYNQHTNKLLQQIQMLKESEKKYQDLQQQHSVLNEQLSGMHRQLAEKDTEINRILQEQRLVLEMNERMDKAYADFTQMQEKLRKLEQYLDQPHGKRIEYEQLQESYFKLSREFDEVKGKQIALFDENQRMRRILADTEDKLKEANFHRQQYQKKMLFLEELNRDLQDATEQHKKMESQLRRISEMDSILSRSFPKEPPSNPTPSTPII
jgi:DNA repair exonuclease SbcCD ATPase subunit